jgi:acyl transferase domain-containing protein
MGRELLATESAFKESIIKADHTLKELGKSWSLIEELTKDEKSSLIQLSSISQPVCTAVQIALVDLLNSLDIWPSAVLGHSSGEVASAYAAGAISHRSAMAIASLRGFEPSARTEVAKPKGGMLAIGLGEPEALKYISQVKSGKVVVACVNSPRSTTISGDIKAIDELETILSQQDDPIFNRKLKVDTAYHSHHMAESGVEYLRSLQGLESGVPRPDVKFFSSVTGKEMQTGFGAQYVCSDFDINLILYANQSHSGWITYLVKSNLAPLFRD